MILLSDFQYLSPTIYYFKARELKYCLFEQYEHFQKMGFRNRCMVAGASGPVTLTIPLEGGRNQRRIIKDVRILNSEKWQDNHWKTLMSLYNRSPFFEYFRDSLEALFAKRFDFLIDWDLECFQWVCDKLAIKPQASVTNTYLKNYPEEEYVDWRNRLKPSTMDQHFPDAPRYWQVFSERNGFIPNLSVLDYLFCTGGRSTC